jgi:hypothetical protein
MRRKNRAPARVPHPDPRTELELQRILAARAMIARTGELIGLHHQEIDAARCEQDNAGFRLRNPVHRLDGTDLRGYELQMQAQRDRIADATARIADAEQLIAATHERISELAAKLSDPDLAYLDAL